MDGGRLDMGVAKGSLSKELTVVGRVAVVSAVLGMLSSLLRTPVGTIHVELAYKGAEVTMFEPYAENFVCEALTVIGMVDKRFIVRFSGK
jgi:hypothetical protein